HLSRRRTRAPTPFYFLADEQVRGRTQPGGKTARGERHPPVPAREAVEDKGWCEGVPRPGFEPGTPSLEARHDVRFTIGARKRQARTATDMVGLSARQSGRQDLNLRCPASKAGGLDQLSYVLRVETMGIEPITGYLQGSLAPLAHAPPQEQRS